MSKTEKEVPTKKEVAYPLLRVEKKELPRGRVGDSDQIYDKEQSAR
jgi:hypothetical protein